jgi:hypothetical protein
MNKRGKKALFGIFGIFMAILLVAGIFAEVSNNASADQPQINQITEEKTDNSISADVSNYVANFVEKKGIDPNSINNITQVDFNSLPKEVAIKNVDNSNLAIYQIDYNKTPQQNNKVFVVTYSVGKLASQGDLIVSQDKREFLNFGFSGETTQSTFLQSSSGVEGSLDNGYVMMRSGSITGISTSLNAVNTGGTAEIVIYKNGKQIQFGNTIVADSTGAKKDYDTQSDGTVTFEAGDVISGYVKLSDGADVKDVNTLVEISTSD